MPINVSAALDSDTALKLTVKRFNTGTYVDGIYQEGTSFTFKVLASPQQPSPKEMERLPEGQRDKDIKAFYCNKELRTVDDKNNVQADQIYFKGEFYEIIHLADWETFGHTIAYGAKVK